MIEALLNLLFNKTDIINYRNTDEGELYLRRWFIWPRKPADLKMVSRVYLHKFYTGDSDRHLHDHPWPFTSLILKGGYEEFRFNPAWLRWKAAMDLREGDLQRSRAIRAVGRYWAGNTPEEELESLRLQTREAIRNCPEPEQTLSTWYGPGSLLRRGAAWAHSVKLKTNKDGSTRHAWSLVFTGIKCRSWGFHTEGGWCWWRFYTHGACVCYDNPNETLPGKGSSKLEQARATKPKE